MRRDKPRGLIDTGAILASLNRKDPWHRHCVGLFTSLPLPLATSTAVLTEVFHLLDRSLEPSAVWALFRSGALTVLPIEDDDLPSVEELMHRYRDRPMDFADATLVHLAKREGLSTVF